MFKFKNKNSTKKPKSVFDAESDLNPNNSADEKSLYDSMYNENQSETESSLSDSFLNQQNYDPSNLNVDELNKNFFEKFEKTKKDLKKQKKEDRKKALRSSGQKNKLLLRFEINLRDPAFLKKTWVFIILGSILFMGYSIGVLSVLANQFNTASDNKWVFLNLFSGLNRTSIVFSGITVGLIPIPYVFLIASWFIGINNVHQSKYYMASWVVILGFCGLLFLIFFPMSVYLFSLTGPFQPISN